MKPSTLAQSALLATIALCGTAVGADASAGRDAYQCAVDQHAMLSAYHFYASDPKDRIQNADFLNARQSALDCAHKVAEQLSAAGMTSQAGNMKSLKDKVAQTSQYNANTIAKTGMSENAVVKEMVDSELALIRLLVQAGKDFQSNSKIKEVAEASQARELALTIMYANARYIERTTQIVLRDDSAEPTIDELAARFDRALAGLRKSKRLSAEQHKKLDNVNTRFRFINGSLNNYTQQAVPSTVNRHARSMVAILGQVADGLEGTSDKGSLALARK